MRWLFNILIILLAALLCFACLLFLIGNPEPVRLELLITAWQPQAPLGQWLLMFLLGGLLLGLLAGLLIAGAFRFPRRPSRS